jgi:hypothetical protein
VWLGTVIPSKHQVKDEVGVLGAKLVTGNFFNFFLGAVRALGQERSDHVVYLCRKTKPGCRPQKKKALVSGKCGILFTLTHLQVFQFQDQPSVWEARKFLCFSF